MRNAIQLFNRTRVPAWSMFEDFDRLFEQALAVNEGWPEGEARFSVKTDVEETEKAFLLNFDLPGMKREDVRIDLAGQVLTVSGERKREFDGGAGATRRIERSYGKFERAFTLPKTVDADKIEAHLENGVLRIALPKVEDAKPRAIEIGNEAKNGGFFEKLIGKNQSEK